MLSLDTHFQNELRYIEFASREMTLNHFYLPVLEPGDLHTTYMYVRLPTIDILNFKATLKA